MAQEDAPRAGTAASAAKVILLVEDDVDTAQVITDLIAQETPHRVFVADCQGVLKFVRVIKPDLPLLDYLLPGTTGIALYDHLHANRTLAAVPAVIISAAYDWCQADVEGRHLPGLRKPFHAADLLSLIGALLA